MTENFQFFAEDWEYMTEGGSSIILVPKCTEGFPKRYSSYVMKILKKKLSYNYDFYQEIINEVFTESQTNRFDIVCLDNQEVIKLIDRIKVLRSNERLNQGDKSFYANFGIIEKNLTLYQSLTSKFQISFEFKVKCGFKSYSPFIEDDRSIKLLLSRFKIMQLVKLHGLKSRGISTQPWGEFKYMSDYDPADLCSRSISKVNRALDSLVSNPQNNLRICIDGKHVYGWDKSKDEDRKYFLSTIETLKTSFNFDILSIISNELVDSDILERLESLQSIDAFIDIEGCGKIYERLLKIYGNDHNLVTEKLLSSKFSQSAQELKLIHQWLKQIETINYEEHFNNSLKSTSELDDISIVSKILPLISILYEKSPLIKQKRLCEWIGNLSEDDCLQLLNLWLVALGAKDASLIINVQETSGYYLDYNVHTVLIDTGPKPVSKIKKKIEEEGSICEKAKLIYEYL